MESVPKNDNEKRILSIPDDILENQTYRNIPPQDERFLRLVTESMNAKNVDYFPLKNHLVFPVHSNTAKTGL